MQLIVLKTFSAEQSMDITIPWSEWSKSGTLPTDSKDRTVFDQRDKQVHTEILQLRRWDLLPLLDDNFKEIEANFILRKSLFEYWIFFVSQV